RGPRATTTPGAARQARSRARSRRGPSRPGCPAGWRGGRACWRAYGCAAPPGNAPLRACPPRRRGASPHRAGRCRRLPRSRRGARRKRPRGRSSCPILSRPEEASPRTIGSTTPALPCHTGAMRSYDVFNGDADGICALHQLRLADPVDSELVTGLKRDIELLKAVPAERGDVVTVLDVSLDRNRAALAALLERGVRVRYFD